MTDKWKCWEPSWEPFYGLSDNKHFGVFTDWPLIFRKSCLTLNPDEYVFRPIAPNVITVNLTLRSIRLRRYRRQRMRVSYQTRCLWLPPTVKQYFLIHCTESTFPIFNTWARWLPNFAKNIIAFKSRNCIS